ncbi:MAG: DUF389 domain-containing protein [Acidobacteria bacterium]|nr:DUF389 domain-containing protein [Candidatus Sulfomarinibacter kjeldsenii]
MAPVLIAWAQTLADKDEETTFLCLETGFDGRTTQAVREALGEKGASVATLIAIDDPMPVARVREYVRKRNIRLLLTGPFALPAVGGKDQTADELVRAASCRTFALLYGEKAPSEIKKVLFVPTGREHDRSALRLVETLRQRRMAQVTIGAIEDETGAKAGQTGERYIRALLHEEALDEEAFEVKVVVDRLKHRGVVELFEDHDLIVTGANAASRLHPLRQSLGDATVAIVKRTPPLSKRAIADWLPSINPADHADLLHDLSAGSVWGPDFIGMLGLASAIATLGLLQNSPAVVIGSMLLAPLMTPMIGLGLALGQADVRVMRLCGKSIALGFLLTLAVSFLIGIITPTGATLTEEVLARGGPNVLDLLIAVFAAAAATFAMARPNISGAIAGVAIATALVPPVCAVGISLAHGGWLNAFGASALFFTNLIAIIVMSSFTFSLLGITASRALPRHRRRAQLGRWSLVVLLLALAGPLSTTLVAQLEEGKSVPIAYPVTRAVGRAVFERVAQDEGVDVMFIARPRAEHRVMIHVASRDELPLSYANELRKIVRDVMDDAELPVNVVAVRGLWRSDSDSPKNGSP